MNEDLVRKDEPGQRHQRSTKRTKLDKEQVNTHTRLLFAAFVS